MKVVLCPYGSGVQHLAESINGDDYCINHCGPSAPPWYQRLSDMHQKRICEEYDSQWRKLREKKKTGPEACRPVK